MKSPAVILVLLFCVGCAKPMSRLEFSVILSTDFVPIGSPIIAPDGDTATWKAVFESHTFWTKHVLPKLSEENREARSIKVLSAKERIEGRKVILDISMAIDGAASDSILIGVTEWLRSILPASDAEVGRIIEVKKNLK